MRTSGSSRVTWMIVSCLAAFAVACGSSGGGTTDPGATDNPIANDAGEDQGIAGDPGADGIAPADPGAESAEDPGGDEPGCACNTDDECCDGCNPIHEGEPCGEQVACVTGGACQAGKCVAPGVPVACPDVPCQLSQGCDAAKNECVYEPLPDGEPCQAKAGYDGSGACRLGECLGYGECDMRVYDQPTNRPCNFDAECASGRCLAWGDGWTTWCAEPCGPDKPACPEGTACVVTGGDGGRYCRPVTKESVLGGDAATPIYRVCNRNEDCAGGLCLSSSGRKYCSAECKGALGADDKLCGDCGRCRDNGDELDFPFKHYCVPKGTGGTGDPCGANGDCKTGFCHEGYCSEQCIDFEGVSNCPADMKCVAGPFDGDPELKVCAKATEVGVPFGAACLGDWACAEGACLDVTGTMQCSAACDDETPCAVGKCVDTGLDTVCVPDDQVAVGGQGDRCDADYQCVSGYVCFMGACLRGCEKDGDCEDGATCFGDDFWQATYCTPACDGDGGCAAGRLGCLDGRCVLTADGQRFLYSVCRLDADCETGACRAGQCTDTCGETTPCEGSTPIVPVKDGLCQPCNPNLYGADCNAGDWGINECVQGWDGKYFCAPNCLLMPGCPVGTRCYQVTSYQQVCAPLSGSCSAVTACTTGGECVLTWADDLPCTEDAECAKGKCVDGRCASTACTADADCGCAMLGCAAGECVIDPDAAVAEVEPNDGPETAQVLSGGSVRVAGTLVTAGDVADRDLYKVHLLAGQVLDLRTDAFCDGYGDTLLVLMDEAGVPIPDWANEDIDPNGNFFSALLGYRAKTDQDVIVSVQQSIYQVGFARFSYVLDVDVFDEAANDRCEGAIALVEGLNYIDLATATDDYQSPECAGWPAYGKDAAYSISVPAGKYLVATLDAPFDSQLYLVRDCADVDGTCLAGADRVYEPGKETLVWANATDAPVAGLLVVDTFLIPDSTQASLFVELRDLVPPGNDTIWDAPLLAPGLYEMPGVTVGAKDDFDPAGASCGGANLPGPDVFWRVNLQPGDFLTVGTPWSAAFVPVIALSRDPQDPAACVAVASSFVSWKNETAEPVGLFIVVDGATATSAGLFDIRVESGAPAGCFGPCDPATYARACVEGAADSMCWCDPNAYILTPVDCNAWCRDANDALSGTCRVYTTPGYEGTGCECTWDCAEASESLCDNGYLTHCTCGADDPCGWKANAHCETFCSTEYPADHFDDSADCAM